MAERRRSEPVRLRSVPDPVRRSPVLDDAATARPAHPGTLDDQDRAHLAELSATARRTRDWRPLAERLVRLRARGVPVGVLADTVGVEECRLRMVCRDHGPDPATLADPLAERGWVPTAAAAGLLGVSVPRLLEHTGDATAAGVAVMAGWSRVWHAPSLPRWWAARHVDPRTGPQRLADDRARRVRALVAEGATAAAAAAQVGVCERTAHRYLRRESARTARGSGLETRD